MAETIGNGLEIQIERFKSEHADLKLVVIDTLQKVRGSTENSYGSDYKELSVLKGLADKLRITVLLVHHTRKCKDNDPFNMISGSAGISGCVDGSLVLIETKRGSRTARLYCVGRDIENHELNLAFESNRWTVTDEESPPPSKDNIFLAAVYVFIKDAGHFEGTATELIEALKTVSNENFHSNRVTRDLVQNGYKLKQCGIDFCCGRNHSGRKIILDYCSARDGSDSKNGSGVTVTKQLTEVLQSQ